MRPVEVARRGMCLVVVVAAAAAIAVVVVAVVVVVADVAECADFDSDARVVLPPFPFPSPFLSPGPLDSPGWTRNQN